MPQERQLLIFSIMGIETFQKNMKDVLRAIQGNSHACPQVDQVASSITFRTTQQIGHYQSHLTHFLLKEPSASCDANLALRGAKMLQADPRNPPAASSRFSSTRAYSDASASKFWSSTSVVFPNDSGRSDWSFVELCWRATPSVFHLDIPQATGQAELTLLYD